MRRARAQNMSPLHVLLLIPALGRGDWGKLWHKRAQEWGEPVRLDLELLQHPCALQGGLCISCCPPTTSCPSKCLLFPGRILVPALLSSIPWHTLCPVSAIPCPLLHGGMLIPIPLSPSLEHLMPLSLGTPILPCPVTDAHHSWKFAAWVESEKSMPITTLAVSPGARCSGTTRLSLHPTFSPNPHPHSLTASWPCRAVPYQSQGTPVSACQTAAWVR